MKRLCSLLAAALLLAAVIPARAQDEVERLAWLTVELWPDYDRPDVLVLLTGAVPEDAPLPAAVTVPVPADATINAVARITDDNALIDDIEFTTADGSLRLITPDRRFRVEYYTPYQTDGARRSYTFNWLADVTVDELSVAVQEPENATSLEVEPEAVEVVPGFEEFNYHNLSPASVPAGVSYTVTLEYRTEPEAEVGGGFLEGANLPVLLAVGGGVLVLLALAWQLWGERLGSGSRQARKPRPVRKSTSSAARRGQPGKRSGPAKFCHQCGEEVEAGDRFCRNCGTRLKGTG